MLNKTSYRYFPYYIVLSIFFFSTNQILGQQKSIPQKKTSLAPGITTTVWIHMPYRNDTSFQSGDNKPENSLNKNISDSIKKLPAGFYLPVPGNSSKNTNTSFIEGAISLTVNSTPASCSLPNGHIVVTATGGMGPYTFFYTINGNTSSQNTGDFKNLKAGTYQITVTDVNGQTATTVVDLPNITPIGRVDSYQFPTSCTSFDGGLTFFASGGVPPYLYSLDNVNFQVSNVFTNLSQGIYQLFVKDASGCIFQRNSIFLNSTNNSCFGIGFSYSYTSCNNDGNLSISTVLYGTAPYQYSLDGVNYQAGGNFNNLGTGFHHLYIKDATGFVTIFGFTITQYCPLNISAAIVDAACGVNNGTLTVTATFGTAPYTYTLDGVNYQSSNIFTRLAAGNYTVIAKDANGVSVSANETINNNCPAVTAIFTSETCGQKNATITATGFKGTLPYRFSIDGINFKGSNTFTGLAAGSYTVIIKDANGFTGTTPVTITANCLQLSLNITNVVCSNANGSVLVSVAGGVAPYQYSIDGINFQANNVFTGLASNSYTITIKDAANSGRDTLIKITDAPAPNVNAAITQASCNNTNGSIKINTIGGVAPLTYSIDNNNFLNTNIFNNLDSGTYVAYIKDANGCLGTDTVQLTALTTPKVSIGKDTSICSGETVMLAAPSAPGYKFLWQDNTTTYNYNVIKQGIYYVKVTNQYNCSASDTIQIIFKSVPEFTIGNDSSLCTGQTVLLKPIPLLSGSYLWNTGVISPSVTINTGGVFWLQITYDGCVKADTIKITYNPKPVIRLGNDTTLCAGKILTLNATNTNATYTWQDGSTQPVYTVNKAGLYSVKVLKNGCDTSGKINVNYITKPVIHLPTDTVICVTQHLLLDVYYPQSTYLWQDGSMRSQFNVVRAGSYKVAVTNTCGATSASIDVTAKNCACKFYIPTAFTPDNDGKNDVFEPVYQCQFSDYEMRIFNRWGQLIFTSQSPATGWNGVFKNEPQPVGVYVYEIMYKDNLTGKAERIKGWVTLLR